MTEIKIKNISGVFLNHYDLNMPSVDGNGEPGLAIGEEYDLLLNNKNQPAKVYSSKELIDNITDGDVILLEGTRELSTAKSLQWAETAGIRYAHKVSEFNEIPITDQSDFPGLVLGNIPIENGMKYVLKTDVVFINNPIDYSNVTSISSIDFNGNVILYTGSGDIFQGTPTGLLILESGIVNSLTSADKIWDLTGNGGSGNVIFADTLSFSGFAGVGTVSNLGQFSSVAGYRNCGTGLVFNNIKGISVNDTLFINAVSSNSPRMVLEGQSEDVIIESSPVTALVGESVLQVSQDFNATGSVIINSNNYKNAGGGEFLASEKIGSITIYADNLSGGTTVTSVAHTLTTEKTVEIIGSGVGAYDAIHNGIFNTIVGVSFDIPVAFVSDPGTGVFSTGNSNDFQDVFEIQNNGDAKDSAEIGKMQLGVGKSIVITPLVVGTPILIQGIANDWVPVNMRRYTFESDGFGSMRYTHTKEVPTDIKARVTGVVTGGSARTMTAYIAVNGVHIPDSRFKLTDSLETTFAPSDLIDFVQNDYTETAIANDVGLQTITITENSLEAVSR